MRCRVAFVICSFFVFAIPVVAGMPAPLPTNIQPNDFESSHTVDRLSGSAIFRAQAISFFVFVFVLCALAVHLLWRFLRRDFPSLPRLSFGKSLVVVFLWGLLFVIVLTMISGARELMTPGAWQRSGYTYKLSSDREQLEDPLSEPARREHLEKLRSALWKYAATHNGRFPGTDEAHAIASELWAAPGGAGLRYSYVPGQTAGPAPTVLAYEPELDSQHRLVLCCNGDVVAMNRNELRSALERSDK